jgi:hypothetical protein
MLADRGWRAKMVSKRGVSNFIIWKFSCCWKIGFAWRGESFGVSVTVPDVGYFWQDW